MSRLNAPDEEQFILRLPADVADRMRATLRGHPSARHEDQHMELNFLGALGPRALARPLPGHCSICCPARARMCVCV
jgi:hypothetical protein